jgi:hypothetical protein
VSALSAHLTEVTVDEAKNSHHRPVVWVVVNRSGADLTNDEKGAHLIDSRRPINEKLPNCVIYL